MKIFSIISSIIVIVLLCELSASSFVQSSEPKAEPRHKRFVLQAGEKFVINKIYDLGGDIYELPANCTLIFKKGKFVNGTLIFKNTYISGNYRFDCLCKGTVKNRMITPQMFGAKGDGKSDDTKSIRNACLSNADTLFFPRGTYIINIEPGTNNKDARNFFPSNVYVIRGENGSIIKLGKDNGNTSIYKGYESIFSFSGKDVNVSFSDLTFDFNYKSNPIYQYTSNCVGVEQGGQQMAINAYRVASLVVENCTFIDHSGTNCIDYRAHGEAEKLYCKVSNCKFQNIGKKSIYKGKEAYHDCSTLSLHCDRIKHKSLFVCEVTNNVFEGVGGNAYDACECSAEYFTFANNKISGYVVGVMPLANSPYTKAYIHNNNFNGVARGVGLWSCDIDTEQEVGSIGFDILNISNNYIVVDVESFIKRPNYSTLNSKKNDMYPGGYFSAICSMGGWTKSINKLEITQNKILYKDCQAIDYNLFVKNENFYNGAVIGIYNLFTRNPTKAQCVSFIFEDNKVYNPIGAIVRLTPFNEIDYFSFTGNLISGCWKNCSAEVRNAGLISINPAIYNKTDQLKWVEFHIENNEVISNGNISKGATVFWGTSAEKNHASTSTLVVRNNKIDANKKSIELSQNKIFNKIIID